MLFDFDTKVLPRDKNIRRLRLRKELLIKRRKLRYQQHKRTPPSQFFSHNSPLCLFLVIACLSLLHHYSEAGLDHLSLNIALISPFHEFQSVASILLTLRLKVCFTEMCRLIFAPTAFFWRISPGDAFKSSKVYVQVKRYRKSGFDW